MVSRPIADVRRSDRLFLSILGLAMALNDA